MHVYVCPFDNQLLRYILYSHVVYIYALNKFNVSFPLVTINSYINVKPLALNL